jgi:hypothetical protein
MTIVEITMHLLILKFIIIIIINQATRSPNFIREGSLLQAVHPMHNKSMPMKIRVG